MSFRRFRTEQARYFVQAHAPGPGLLRRHRKPVISFKDPRGIGVAHGTEQAGNSFKQRILKPGKLRAFFIFRPF